jgi:hypothetical protein
VNVRSSALFGAENNLVLFVIITFFCLGADTRRDERSSAPSVRRGQHFCFVPAERCGSPGAGFIGDPVQPVVMWPYGFFHFCSIIFSLVY